MAFRVALLSDTHAAPPGTPDSRWHGAVRLSESLALLRGHVDRAAELGVDALVHLGDLTDAGDAASADAALAELFRLDRPCYLVNGNHDVTRDGDLLGAAIARSGRADRLVPLDGAPRLLADGIRIAGTRVRSTGSGWDTLTVDAPAADAVGTDDLLLWATHFPVLPLGGVLARAGLADAGDTRDDAGSRRALAGRRGPTLVLHGHQHVRHVEVAGPLAQYGVPASVEGAALTVLALEGPRRLTLTPDVPGARPLRLAFDGDWSASGARPSAETVGIPASRIPNDGDT
jgi:hypothetical protein